MDLEALYTTLQERIVNNEELNVFDNIRLTQAIQEYGQDHVLYIFNLIGEINNYNELLEES